MKIILNKHILFSFCVYSFLVVCISSFAAAEAIPFRGKVVDSQANPVGFCKLVLELNANEILTEKVITCDPNGLFEFKCDADTIEVKTVFREGYVLDQRRNMIFDVARSKSTRRPVRIVLKKSDKPGIARNSYRFIFWQDTPKDFLIDLSKDRGKEYPVMSKPRKNIPKKPAWSSKTETDKTKKFHKAKQSPEAQKKQKPKKVPKQIQDVKLSARFLEKEQVWGLVFLPLSEGTVFQILDEARPRCPLEEYSPVAFIPAAVNEQLRKYVYVKAREGQIYSRLAIDIKSNEKTLIVSISNHANTMGSPVLEIKPKGDLFDSNEDKFKQELKNIEKQQRRQRDKERKFQLNNGD